MIHLNLPAVYDQLPEPVRHKMELVLAWTFGRAAHSIFRRWRAADDAAAATTTAKGKVEVAKLEVEAEKVRAKGAIEIEDLKQAAQYVAEFKAEEYQRNRESIAKQSFFFYGELAKKGEVNEDPVEPEWVDQFFDYAKNKGDAEIQSLWARILAGEVAQPGSFSLLTLSRLKMLTKREAESFTNLCSHIWETPEGAVAIVSYQTDYGDEVSSVPERELLRLESYGLIKLRDDLSHHDILSGGIPGKAKLDYFDRKFHAAILPVDMLDTIRIAILTSVGEELRDIAGANPDYEYMEFVLTHMRRSALEITQQQ